MSSRVKKHLPLLKWLSANHPKKTKPLLRTIDKEVLDTICECCYNVLKGNVPLTATQKRRLNKHKHVMRRLTGGKKVPIKKKRQLVQTGGGFMSSLLAPILSIFGKILTQ